MSMLIRPLRLVGLAAFVLVGGCNRSPVVDVEPVPEVQLPRKEEPSSTLAGKPAPAFTSKTLDGQDFALQDLQGKIVMLDFWATWCGPCVVELPVLLKLAGEFADRGVVLYGVNQGEDSETIQSFLQKQGWELPVVLDEDGKIGSAYDVEGIPQLVLIDPSGQVQQVHVGYRPDIEQVLRGELEQLVAAGAK